MSKIVATGQAERLIVGLFALGLGIGLGAIIAAAALGLGRQSGSVEAQFGGGTHAACVSLYSGQARFMYPGQPANCTAGEFAIELGSGGADAGLDARLTALEAKVPDCLSEDGNQDAVFEGCNVHVRSGSGSTHGTLNGEGNLIVGYNENVNSFARTGSHNLVIGSHNGYTSYGGLVAGTLNKISGAYASVSGGSSNTASGESASVSGGTFNTASNFNSSVSGGWANTASGDRSSVSGGASNMATGLSASISGGQTSEARGDFSSVSGGHQNLASGIESSVSGGLLNVASGMDASVSGGFNNQADGERASVGGGVGNRANAYESTIGGGSNQTNNTNGSFMP